MANESKTMGIVRRHFEKFGMVNIEEQKSDNPIIDKLLQTASKKGLGKGFPDFIITYKGNSELLIVIECKAKTSNHVSSNRDKYADFAVDGVLLYASYLSKDFDVLAIAVSGDTQKNLKIAHFLHLKRERKASDIFGDKLLQANNYLDGYLKSPEKFRQDYKTLLDYTKKLNETLHSHKILGNQRGILISCILIALENNAFKYAYLKHKSSEDLATHLIQIVSGELQRAGITSENLTNLNTHFGFIKTDTSLSKKEEVLKELIYDIDENINRFIKTHEYYDVLGHLYTEFLRYANSDKGLGIVLTPSHITELFAILAQVNKETIVYDNCVGTGGFLISAMKKMIESARGDENKIKKIKSNQLIGVEYQAHIYALSVSNMYVHQDGKTNIINENCFDNSVIAQVKKKKPTVGFLNPPYKSDKKTDIDELEFVLNNLECLVAGATCIALVPMQSALAQKGNTFELKAKLLKSHTLEAVLSMPDELFFNSKVGVVSCAMIFTAHSPHPANKETYFGYYKNDGFVKRKTQGRFDALGNWDSIRERWVKNYLNRNDIDGFSVKKIITSNDEWCAESYMKTDYSIINDSDFERTLLDYVAFLFKSRLKDTASSVRKNSSKIILDKNNWSYFKLSDLFKITGSKTTSVIVLEEYGNGDFPYVTTQASNNGVEGFYDYSTEEGNVLTIDSAVLGYCSYQPFDFSASDHVEKLSPKFNMNKYIAIFLVTIINLDQYRYNYGRKCSQSRMKEIQIKLPQKNDKPDWQFMEKYIKSLPYSSSL